MIQLGDFVKSSVIGKVFDFDGDKVSFNKTSLIVKTKMGETINIPYITEGSEDVRN